MPVLNEEASVCRTLDAVFASSRLPDELVIADGGSTDDTINLIQTYRRYNIPIIIADNPGVYAGAGRNVAAGLAAGDVLICLDFGNQPEPGWIASIMQVYESDPAALAVASLFRPVINNEFEYCVAVLQYRSSFRWLRQTQAERIASFGGNIRMGGLGTSVKRELWLRLGGMPGWLRAAEDYLFGEKILRSGISVKLAENAWIHHHMRSTALAVFKQNLIYAKGSARIGQTSENILKPLAFFLLLSITVLGLQSMWGAILLLAAYICLKAYRPLLIVNRKKFHLGYLCYAPAVLLAKEFGSMIGWLIGRVEWLKDSSWRKRRDDYMMRY